MECFIDIQDVSKVYQIGDTKVYALDEISLQIDSGEFTAIIGSSGSGKSTLMNILGCLDFPTKGHYYLNGMDLSQLNDNQLSEIRNKTIGFIFQSFNLIPSLNALENVELQLTYGEIERKKRHQIAKDALIQVGLEQRMYHRPNEMSGGQQQRVAIARAIAASPPVILADEPTGNLDSKSATEIMDILKNLSKKGKTLILITHDESIAQQADRIIKIKDGKILMDEKNS